LVEHALGLEPVLTPFVQSLEAETYGGAMLLGTDGVCIISHGSSSPTAITNAISVAAEMVRSDVVASIATAIRPEPS
jgi:glycerol-3-phosphate acyltransferase PlsX